MNIFLVDKDPTLCAQALDDLRLNKMILETAQMLCVAYKHLYPISAAMNKHALYKETHVNHPCAVWLRESHVINYIWGCKLFKALHDEKFYRTNKVHLSYIKLWHILSEHVNDVSINYNTMIFTFDCSNMYDHVSIFDRYKLCLMHKWLNDKKPPKWIKRGPPIWANNASEIKLKTN